MTVVSTAALSAHAADELALRRVMLSTGGVGYFEYEARVAGDAALSLQIRLDQVDDVLKSIVVYDDRGGIGNISLPGQEPLRDVFRELPFGEEALASPVALFNALRGAEVRSTGGREIAGRLIAVTQEQAQLPNNGGTVLRHRISLMTPLGLRQLVLEETDALQFTDPALQASIGTALAALAQHNERDRRTVTVQTTGAGEHIVRVAYVVEAPLWKTSYRLTLSDDPAAAAGDLQGWAVLENQSGTDWRNVDLTVVSGNPVTFRQALYTAYYVDRPEVPVEVLGRVLPGVDDGTVSRRDDEVSRRGGLAGAGPGMAPSAPAMAMAAPAPAGRGYAQAEMAAPSTGAAPPPLTPPMAQVTAAESTEATTQVVFRVATPVSVANGHSLLVPIVARAIPVERVSLYQPQTQPQHPLASVRLTNGGDSGLPPGVLTLYERAAGAGTVAFIGDARLGALPAGEERLLSFAVDQKVRIDREIRDTETIAQGSIVDGVLRLTRTARHVTTYTIAGAAREPRLVVIEHPRQPGWTLVQPAESQAELTPGAYRLRQPVPAGGTVTLDVVLERPRTEQVSLVELRPQQVEVYAGAAQLSPAIRAAIARLSGFMATIADKERTLQGLENQSATVVRDQERLRANLNAAPRDSDLYRRYLGKLGEQEDTLERLNAQIAETRQALDQARQALRDYARGLTL